MSGKCPKCDRVITHLIGAEVKIKDKKIAWAGSMLLCPHCQTVLGAGIDSTRLYNDLVARLGLQIEKLHAGQ
ncbi:MAG TPA: hypothetical protein VGR14_16660 [Verrucomicrobiae bacterium]|jgi:hypothetical protein|nr:hypothetical protein [Verrucomicrobiae bacterium]